MESRGILSRVLLCITFFGVLLYFYVDRQNDVTRLRLEIPQLAKEIKDLREENTRLQYEIDLFESPQNLMQLASHSEFAHLKYPMVKDVVTIEEGLALQFSNEEKEKTLLVKPKLPIAVGARQ